LSCHGRNHFGQIGTGTAGVPAINENMLLAESFGLGQDHSCAIQFGTVKCWGVGSGTGDTSAGGNASVATPTPVAGLGPMTALFSGGVVSCAAGSQGTVRCWGRNEMGQTGTGLVGTVLAPTLAPALANPVQIAPGTAHGCALDSRGLFRCWGDNTNGAVGNGAFSTTPVRVPQVIPGLAFGTAIATSPTHSCAVLATGAVRCWGANGSGQLGNGTFVHSATPVSVATFFP
jgi:alpha-tubulin suppressor-like RCC1 family protein